MKSQLKEGTLAYCPRCECEIEGSEKRCPVCGYDLAVSEEKREGWAYSPIANVALLMGQALAGLAAFLVLIGCVLDVLRGEFVKGLLSGPIEFLLLVAAFVVFVRVQRL